MFKRKYSTVTKCISAIEKGFTADVEKGLVFTPSGKVATKTTLNGYIQLCIRLNGHTMYLLAHQFIYYLVNKKEVELIDHINENKKDNRISNLRSTTKQINAYNSSKPKGVCFCNYKKKYISYITLNDKRIFLGYFNNYDDARNIYIKKKQEIFNKQLELCK